MAYEEVNYTLLPAHLRKGFKAYIEEHRRPGNFISACLRNDLQAAISRADPVSLANIKEIIQFLWNEAPGKCWGDRELVIAWMQVHSQESEVVAHGP